MQYHKKYINMHGALACRGKSKFLTPCSLTSCSLTVTRRL